jgi:cysteine-rich repeat protein
VQSEHRTHAIVAARRLPGLFFPVLAAAGLLTAAAGAAAEDAKCIATLNKNAARVAAAVGKQIRSCVRAADKSGANGANECSVADANGKLARAKQRTIAQDVGGAQDACGGEAPAFLYRGAAIANDVADDQVRVAAADLFGPDLDASVVTDGDKTKARCRDAVYADATGLFDATLAAWNACKKRALAGGAASPAQVQDACIQPGGPNVVDPKEKLARRRGKVFADVSKLCTEPALDTDALFPGVCAIQADDTEFAFCAVERFQCEACLALRKIDAGLTVDCDRFDDALTNGSCGCGDEAIEQDEECDDGNHASGDLCSNDCQIEPAKAIVLSNPCNGGSTLTFDALLGIGVLPVVFTNFAGFNTAFDAADYQLVIYDGLCDDIDPGTETRLAGWISGGGRALVAYWDLQGSTALQNALGVTAVNYSEPFRDVYPDLAGPASIFERYLDVLQPLVAGDTGEEFEIGQELTLTRGGFLAARLDTTSGPGAVAVTNGGRTVAIGFTPELLGVHDDAAAALDADSDTIPDMQEIWENLISIVFSAPPDAS